MVVTRNQTAPEPLALFQALLHGNASMARRLLAGSGAAQLALVAPVGNFTVLHASVLGNSAAAIPLLAAVCAAAGVPVDSPLQVDHAEFCGGGTPPLYTFLHSLGIAQPARCYGLWSGMTALPLAVWYEDAAAVEALLQAGASISMQTSEAVSWLGTTERRHSRCAQVLRPLLEHGLDPLEPAGLQQGQGGCSLLVRCCSDQAAELMLDHLEAQRAAGSLQLGSKRRCLQLLLGACRSRSPPLQLVQCALIQLQQLSGAEAVGAGDAAVLNTLLLDAAAAGHATVLSDLLASQLLPWDFGIKEPTMWIGAQYRRKCRGYSLLAAAATSPQPAACVRLLNRAGAVPTAEDLYCVVDELRPEGVAALLACRVPTIDTSQPAAVAPLPQNPNSHTAWSCPIHRTLHQLIERLGYGQLDSVKPAVQILEALRTAGMRPAVYTNAALPGFAWPVGNRVLAELDPFDFYDSDSCRERGLPVSDRYGGEFEGDLGATAPWALYAAKDGSWSPDTHFWWPEAFKAAARTLLLVANRSGRVAGSSGGEGSSRQRRTTRRRRGEAGSAPESGQAAGCTLGALPAELLLRIVKAAAEPLSVWL